MGEDISYSKRAASVPEAMTLFFKAGSLQHFTQSHLEHHLGPCWRGRGDTAGGGGGGGGGATRVGRACFTSLFTQVVRAELRGGGGIPATRPALHRCKQGRGRRRPPRSSRCRLLPKSALPSLSHLYGTPHECKRDGTRRALCFGVSRQGRRKGVCRKRCLGAALAGNKVSWMCLPPPAPAQP